MVELKDLKFSKYKEHGCDRCRQIAEDLDSIEKTGDVQKPRTIVNNEKSNRTNETTPINSPKSIGIISIFTFLFTLFLFHIYFYGYI